MQQTKTIKKKTEKEKPEAEEPCASVQPYQPSLGAAWLFNRSMALRIGQLRIGQLRKPKKDQAMRQQSTSRMRGSIPPNHINRLLRCSFGVQQVL